MNKSIYLKKFKDEHMALFFQWLNAGHVKLWFSHPQAWLDEVRGRHAEYDWIQHYIIFCDETPIGFCQFYQYWKSGEDWHSNIPLEGTYSIDYLIGEQGYLHKGHATRAIQLLNHQIDKQADAKRIIVKPDDENQLSQRTLLSAGFAYDAKNKLFIRAAASF